MIGAFPSAAVGLVIPAIADLSERHPELSCTVRGAARRPALAAALEALHAAAGTPAAPV